jgi:hypothetical protein
MRFPEQWTPAERRVADATKQAVAVRRASKALSEGNLNLIETTPALESDLLVFTRTSGADRALACGTTDAPARRTASAVRSCRTSPSSATCTDRTPS